MRGAVGILVKCPCRALLLLEAEGAVIGGDDFAECLWQGLARAFPGALLRSGGVKTYFALQIQERPIFPAKI